MTMVDRRRRWLWTVGTLGGMWLQFGGLVPGHGMTGGGPCGWLLGMGARGLLDWWYYRLGDDSEEYLQGRLLAEAGLLGCWVALALRPWGAYLAAAWSVPWLVWFYRPRLRRHWSALVMWSPDRPSAWGR